MKAIELKKVRVLIEEWNDLKHIDVYVKVGTTFNTIKRIIKSRLDCVLNGDYTICGYIDFEALCDVKEYEQIFLEMPAQLYIKGNFDYLTSWSGATEGEISRAILPNL